MYVCRQRVHMYIHTDIRTDTRQPQRQDCLPIAFWFSKYDTLDSYVVTYTLVTTSCRCGHATCTLGLFTEERGINSNHIYLANPQCTNCDARTTVVCVAQ